jgi:hypothetical protein
MALPLPPGSRSGASDHLGYQRDPGAPFSGARLWRLSVALVSLPPEEDVENFPDRDLVQTFPADRLVRM